MIREGLGTRSIREEREHHASTTKQAYLKVVTLAAARVLGSRRGRVGPTGPAVGDVMAVRELFDDSAGLGPDVLLLGRCFSPDPLPLGHTTSKHLVAIGQAAFDKQVDEFVAARRAREEIEVREEFEAYCRSLGETAERVYHAGAREGQDDSRLGAPDPEA